MTQVPRFNQVCGKCCDLFGNPERLINYERFFQHHEVRALLCKTVDRCHLGTLLFANIDPSYKALLCDDTELEPSVGAQGFELTFQLRNMGRDWN
jgi:hypothetical protein